MIAVLLAAVVSFPLSFTAPKDPRAGVSTVDLRYTSVGDDSLAGQAERMEVRSSVLPLTLATWPSAALVANVVPGIGWHDNVLEGTPGVINVGLPAGTSRYFACRTVDDAGNWSGLSNVVRATASPTPGRAIAYVAEGEDAWAFKFSVTVYGDSDGISQPVPKAPGTPDKVWLRIGGPYTAADPQGVTYRLRPVWSDGIVGEVFASWRVAIVAADGTYFLDRTDPHRAFASGGAWWGVWREPDGTSGFLPMESQAIVQRALANRIQALFPSLSCLPLDETLCTPWPPEPQP